MENIVISTVGKNSLHKNWISNNYDLCLISYDDSNYKQDCKYFYKIKGHKYNLIYQILDKLNYKNYFLIDDDILIRENQINKFFYLFDKYKFSLAQPSLKGHYSHEITLRQNCLFRYTNFVEIMMPCFNRETLEECKETFIENISGFGLDYLWGKILNYKNMGIIDCISATHTRQVFSENFKDISFEYEHITISQSFLLL